MQNELRDALLAILVAACEELPDHDLAIVCCYVGSLVCGDVFSGPGAL